MMKMAFGPVGMMEFNFRNEHTACLVSHSKFMVFPSLHLNDIQPKGIPTLARFVSARVLGNYLLALIDNNQVVAFNKFTSQCDGVSQINKN